MHSTKELVKYTKKLTVLYVEDDKQLQEDTLFLLEPFFKEISTASDGAEGLETYNKKFFDLVITDISMPVMNGIEMLSHIKEINSEQKVIAISAHNESDILIDLIKAGVSSFILKPIIQNELIDILYPVCRDAYTQVLNIELAHELNEKNDKLEKQLKALMVKDNTIDIKHNQVEKLLQKYSPTKIAEDYFEEETDEGIENVVFIVEDSDDILEYFNEISESLSTALIYSRAEDIQAVSDKLKKISQILYRYTPYLDSLSLALNDLSNAIIDNIDEFTKVLVNDSDSVLGLFDAVSSDMHRYVERFSVESLAMRNAHHIHEPTTLSIRQIISFFVINEDAVDEIEFF
ncbi:MAG: response regulator [Sulfurimonas sp.]|nr:response regulator [Sulfurimonas sp.]